MGLKARRQAWVKALLSDKYSQDTSYLKTDDGFCCLGVICDIEGVEWSEETKSGERGYMFGKEGEAEGLNVALMERYGLNGIQGQLNDTIYWIEGEWQREVPPEQYSYSSYDGLAEANDDGRSFKDIADLINDFPELVWADDTEG